MSRINSGIKEAGYELGKDDIIEVETIWKNVIRRFLLNARAFQHGGAFLITDTDHRERLKIQYGIYYDRIPQLFENWMCYRCIYLKSFLSVVDRFLIDDCHIEIDSYLKSQTSKNSADDAKQAISESIRFIASLSRIDGLVLLDTDLVVHGFGCEIITQGVDNIALFHADASIPSRGKLRRLDPEKFGTRHRSMLRYCSEDESSVGFVISNDGQVRAISRAGKRVYFWENVQLTDTHSYKET